MADFLWDCPAPSARAAARSSREKMPYVGLYVQDVWRVNGRLTLNVGLRWSRISAAKDQNGFADGVQHGLVRPEPPQRDVYRTRPPA